MIHVMDLTMIVIRRVVSNPVPSSSNSIYYHLHHPQRESSPRSELAAFFPINTIILALRTRFLSFSATNVAFPSHFNITSICFSSATLHTNQKCHSKSQLSTRLLRVFKFSHHPVLPQAIMTSTILNDAPLRPGIIRPHLELVRNMELAPALRGVIIQIRASLTTLTISLQAPLAMEIL
jgi:hypothetical protein